MPDRNQQILGGPPSRAAADSIAEIGFGRAQLILQPSQVGLEPPDEPTVPRLTAPLAFAGDHLDQLAAPLDQLAERPSRLAWQRPGLGSNRFGKPGDGLGVEPVGLGQSADGPGEIPDLARVDNRQRQPGRRQRRCDCHLEAAGRLEHHQLRRQRRQTLHHARKAGGIAIGREGLPARLQIHIQAVLGDVDPDKHRTRRRTLHDPPLQIRARSKAAQATVRVRERDGGRGAELKCGLVHSRPTRAPVHRQAHRLPRAWQAADTRLERFHVS